MEGILTIPFQSPTSEDDLSSYEDDLIWVNLEQASLEEYSNEVRAEDIVAMWRMVLRGESAFTYNSGNCPVSITPSQVILSLDFYVWPSSLDLDYNLTASTGDISIGTQTSLFRSFNLVIPFSKNRAFDYLLDDSISLSWLTSSYGTDGGTIAHPDYEIYKNKILFDEKSFGVMRFAGKAIGYKHTVDVALDYETPENQDFNMGSIRGDFSTTIQIQYVNEKGKTISKSLKLQVPDCLEAMMNTCLGPGGSRVNTKWPTKNNEYYEVRYDVCRPYVTHEGDKGTNIIWEGWRRV